MDEQYVLIRGQPTYAYACAVYNNIAPEDSRYVAFTHSHAAAHDHYSYNMGVCKTGHVGDLLVTRMAGVEKNKRISRKKKKKKMTC